MPEPTYDFASIERKWQAHWQEQGLFRAQDLDASRPPFYCLTMYPYPSGALHMGHVINYTLGDVIVRYKILRGFNVLSPMGWDSFGLPAENAAKKSARQARERGEAPVHPATFTEENIARMRRQMERAGWGYDWTREVATSRPDYYRWTQWLFLLFYRHGLAVKKLAPVNWCASCATVLANEQVLADGTCERCGSPVVQKDLNQWFFAMSQYAQRLLDGHDKLRGHWPDKVLKMQEEWIGRSEGAKVRFTVTETGDPLPVYTTRPDTLWGVTFMVLAPEHPLIGRLVKGTEHEQRVLDAVQRMRAQATSARLAADIEKEGVATGFHVTNPVNGEQVPLWVANFALMSYGTGAVMSVPAHDQRDYEFARKYDLPIRVVIQPPDGKLAPSTMTRAYEAPGAMVQSGPFSGRDSAQAMPEIVRWLEDQDAGEGTVNYRLRDWLVSRQRYWGAPIPIVYCEACGEVPVPESDLPVTLPMDVDFSREGGNPLETCEDFVHTTCPQCGGAARRETDTMDTFVDSSWYFLRYVSPRYEDGPFDRQRVDYWLPVDLYIGGIEHATMHLIYFRFFTQVLHDLELIDFDEPARELFCQGMVCKTAYYCDRCKWIPEDQVRGGERTEDAIEGGACATCGGPVRHEMTKISKSKLNIVDPDDLISRYGADCIRLYMLSDAPPDQQQVWSDARMQGAWRFLNRLWTTVVREVGSLRGEPPAMPASLDADARELRRKTHTAIERVTGAIEGGFRFNTAVSSIMELLNAVRAAKGAPPAVLREAVETMLVLLAPIVPHFAEELWQRLGHAETIFRAGWPKSDPQILAAEQVEIPVQVNGKVRARIRVTPDLSADDLREHALADDAVQRAIQGRDIIKVVAVPGRIVNVAIA